MAALVAGAALIGALVVWAVDLGFDFGGDAPEPNGSPVPTAYISRATPTTEPSPTVMPSATATPSSAPTEPADVEIFEALRAGVLRTFPGAIVPTEPGQCPPMTTVDSWVCVTILYRPEFRRGLADVGFSYHHLAGTDSDFVGSMLMGRFGDGDWGFILWGHYWLWWAGPQGLPESGLVCPAEGINLRAAPGLTSPVLSILRAGTTLVLDRFVLERAGMPFTGTLDDYSVGWGWYHVGGPFDGWVSSKYVSITQERCKYLEDIFGP